MADVMIFHYRDCDSFLVRINPNAKLIALLSYSIIITAAPPIYVFMLALLPVAASFAVKLPWKEYLKESIFFIVLSAFMALTSFLSGGDAFGAASSAVSFLSMVLAAILLTDSTMPDELSRSLGAALSRVIGKRGYVLSSMLEITLSMIPLIIDSTLGIFEARKARGALFISHPLDSLCQLSVSILSDLLDKAEIYIDALYSRGYEMQRRREVLPYAPYDYLIIAISVLALLLKFILLDTEVL